MTTMKIRDSHALINGDKTTHPMPSGGLEIISDDGRALFCITLQKDGSIQVSTGGWCKHGGVLLDDALIIRPRVCNVIEVSRKAGL